MKRCVIIAASPMDDYEYISRVVSKNDFVICADAGYRTAEKANVLPNVIIGDFDSSSKPKGDNVVSLSTKKDDTDTLSAVKSGLAKGFKSFLILNATGGRLDHTLANISTLEYLHNNGASGIISDSFSDIIMLQKGSYSFDLLKGKTISIFPHGCESAKISLSGMMYPLDNFSLKSGYPLGVSNVVAEDNCLIKVLSGKVIFIINKD